MKQRHLFVERRTHHRAEEAPVERTAAEEKQERERLKEIHDEAVELEASTDELLDQIDAVLALGIGQTATAGAA